MIRRSLELIVRRDEDGRALLLSPAVGLYADPPRPGEGLLPGSAGGTLRVLGRTIDLLVPEGAEGSVAEIYARDRSSPVSYLDRLFALAPSSSRRKARTGRTVREAAAGAAGRGAGRAADGSPEDGLTPGEYALRAPTTGIFYARPDPDSPPFVSPGSALETGQTAGLIEVMKCFSPITHPGGAIPSPAIVERVRIREGEDVRPGQILFVLRAP